MHYKGHYEGFVGRYRWLAFCVVCAVVLSGSDGFAQLVNPRVSVFGGASLLGAERSFIVDGDPFRTEFKNGVSFGARGTLDLGEHWAAEGMYSFNTNDLRVTDPGAARTFDLRLHHFAGNAVYFSNPPFSIFRPFATFGMGISRFSATGDAKVAAIQGFLDDSVILRDRNKFTVNLGVGIEAKLWEQVAVRFDFRDYISGMPRLGLPKEPPSPGAPFFPVSGLINRFELSVGVVLYFSPYY